MTDTPWMADPQLLDYARELADALADSGDVEGAAEWYAELAGADPGADAIDLANTGYRDVLDLAAEDRQTLPRRSEDRLAELLGRHARNSYVPAASVEFSSPSMAARELAQHRWGARQPGPVTHQPNCGASDQYGYCIEPYHAAGCGSTAATEIGEALRSSGAYARLAGLPFADADGRRYADQHGRPMTASAHVEAATGQRLGDGAAFETGGPKRELASPQRRHVFGDFDEPGDRGTPLRDVSALAAHMGIAGPDPAAERDRFTERAIAAGLAGYGRPRRPDDFESPRERRERLHRPVQPVPVSEPWNGSLPQYEAG